MMGLYDTRGGEVPMPYIVAWLLGVPAGILLLIWIATQIL